MGVDSITAFHSEKIDSRMQEHNLRQSRICNTIQQDTLQNLSVTSLMNSVVSNNDDEFVLSQEQAPQNLQHQFLIDKQELLNTINQLQSITNKIQICQQEMQQIFQKKTQRNMELSCLQKIIQYLQLFRQSLNYQQYLQEIQSKQQSQLIKQILLIKQRSLQQHQDNNPQISNSAASTTNALSTSIQNSVQSNTNVIQQQDSLQKIIKQINKQKEENKKLKELISLQKKQLQIQSFIIGQEAQKSIQKVQFANNIPTLSPSQQTHKRDQSSNNSFWNLSTDK